LGRRVASVRLEHVVPVDCSAREAFDYLADARHLPVWCSAVRSCEQTALTGPTPGAEYRIARATGAVWWPAKLDLRLETFVAPSELGWVRREGATMCRVECLVTPIPSGVAIHYAESLSWSQLRTSRILLGLRRYQLGHDLWRLKSVLERT
jgi:hypothetical protein